MQGTSLLQATANVGSMADQAAASLSGNLGWASLTQDTLARIIQLGALSENDVACSLVPLDKATRALLRSLGYSGTIHAAKAVPRWAFAARWGAPGAMRDMTLEMRRKLLCCTAASGDLENLELAASVVGCPLGPDVFTAARAAGHGEMLGWLRAAGLTDTDASLEAAGRAGHPNCSPSCIIAAAGAGHDVCGRLRSINSLEERMSIALAAAEAAAAGGYAGECDQLLQLHKEMRDGFLGLHPAVVVFEVENLPQLQAAGLRLLEAAVEGLGLQQLVALHGKWFDRSNVGRGGGGGNGGERGRDDTAGGAASNGISGSSGSSGSGTAEVYQDSGWVLTWRPVEEALLSEARTAEERSAAAAWRAGMDARLLAAAAGSASPQWRAKYEWLKLHGHVARREIDKARVAARAAACPKLVPGSGLDEEEEEAAVERLRYLRGELGVAAVCSARVVAEAVASGNDRALVYVLELAAEAAAEAAAAEAAAAVAAAEAAAGTGAQAEENGALGFGQHEEGRGQSSASAGSSACGSRSCPGPSPTELATEVSAASGAVTMAAARGHLNCLQALRAAGSCMNNAALVAAARAGQMQVVRWLLDECCAGVPNSGGIRDRAVGAEGSTSMDGDEGGPGAAGEVQLTAEVCAAAARSGSLELLALVRGRGCPWGPEAVTAGAQAGCEAVLAYLVAQGCPTGDCHDAYAAAIAAEDVHTLRCLRRLGLPWAGDAATWRAHAIRCGVPLLRWLHEEAQVPVLGWMSSLGSRRGGRRTEMLEKRVLQWYEAEEAKAAEVRLQRRRQEEQERRLRDRKWWQRAAPSEPSGAPLDAGPAQHSIELQSPVSRDAGDRKALKWVRERIAKGWRLGR